MTGGEQDTATEFARLLERNRAFARTDAWHHMPIPFLPRRQAFVITCIDPRVDPAVFLQLDMGEAIVLRGLGGRVTAAVIDEVAYVGYLVETKAPPGAPWFELAVIHHTDCGTAFLADDHFRHGFAERSGVDERSWAAKPVLDPAETVRTDVELLRAAPQLSAEIRISGHVYDLETGLVTTVVEPTSAAAA